MSVIYEGFDVIQAESLVFRCWLEFDESHAMQGIYSIKTWIEFNANRAEPTIRVRTETEIHDGRLVRYKYLTQKRQTIIQLNGNAYEVSDGKNTVARIEGIKPLILLENNNVATVIGVLYYLKKHKCPSSFISLPGAGYEELLVDVKWQDNGNVADVLGLVCEFADSGRFSVGKSPSIPFKVQKSNQNRPDWRDEYIYKGQEDYFTTYLVRHQEIVFNYKPEDIYGTLATPIHEGPETKEFNILLIGGTGRYNRDGLTLDGQNLGYGRLMDAFTFSGFCTFRYDIRASLASEYVLVVDDIINQAKEVVRQLVSQLHKQIVIVGHSFGGYVACRVASEMPKHISGLCLISTPSKDSRTTIKWQQERAINKIENDQLKEVYRKKAMEFFYKLDKANLDDLNITERNSIAFIRSMEELVPKDLVESIHCPVMIMHGNEDNQVAIEDADELYGIMNAQNDRVRLKVISGFGHRLNEFLGSKEREAIVKLDSQIIDNFKNFF